MNVLKEIPKRIPYDGTFELTVRCNLKCKMCLFRHDDNENKDIIENEKKADEWIDLARQVADEGTMNLLLTGGEIMLRPDFCEIYEAIYNMGFIITLYTNATLVSEKIKKTLQKYPPHRIGITIYGSCEEVYERVCGKANAFNKMMDGVNFFKTLPSSLEFRTTIIKDNYEDVDNIENLVKEKFGQNYNVVHTRMVLKPARGGSADIENCRLSPKQNIDLFFSRGIKNIKKVMGSDFDIGKGKFDIDRYKLRTVDNLDNKPQKITLFGCSAGMKSYTITWDGKLIGCQLLGEFFTLPFDQGFKKAWNEYPFKVKILELNSNCKNCKNSFLCYSCPAARLIETGDISGYPSYICKDTEEMINFLKR